MRWPLNSAKALGYGSDCARTKRSMTSAGQDQSTWLSCGARLWKNVACDRSCGVQSVRPDAIRSRASSVMGPIMSIVRWNRSVTVSVGPTVVERCSTMSPASSSSSIRCAVRPTSSSPLIRAQMSGEKPVYLGSSESWMLRVPYLGASKTPPAARCASCWRR